MTFAPIANPIDKITIKGQECPGLAEITGGSTPRKWEQRKGFGMSGAWLKYLGRDLAKFSILIRLSTDQECADWVAFYNAILKPPATRRSAEATRGLEVSHPVLDILDIHSFVPEDVSQPTQIEDGLWQVEIKAIEYRGRPKAQLATLDGSDTTATENPRAAEARRLSAENQRLARELE